MLRFVEPDAVDSDRARNVLHMLLTAIIKWDVELSLQVIICGAGDKNSPRFANLLEAAGDVDAIAEQILTLHHNVPEINANAEDDGVLNWSADLCFCSSCLHRYRAGNRVNDRAKLRNDTVTHHLHDSAVMNCEQRVKDLATQSPHGGKSSSFIGFDQPRVTNDVRSQYCRKPAFHP